MSPQSAPEDNNNNTSTNNVETMLQKMMATQTQLMTMMTQIKANQSEPPPPLTHTDRLVKFLSLEPNTFHPTNDPIMATDWLRSIEKDLILCECTDTEKVSFASYFLEGLAAKWWRTYHSTHTCDTLTWKEFKEGFCSVYSSPDMWNMKQEEFLNLRQGDRTLKEYRDDFYALSRYAPEGIIIEEEREESFLKRLCDEMKVPFTVTHAWEYKALLDQALILEDDIRKTGNLKRKLSINKHHSEPSFKRHHTPEVNHSHKQGNHHNKGSHLKHPDRNGGSKGSNGDRKGNGHDDHNHNNGQHRPNPELKKDNSQVLCFKCNNKGHYANKCPENKLQNNPPQKDISKVMCFKCKNMGHYANKCPAKMKTEEIAKTKPFGKGYMNHTNVEEVIEEPSLVNGMFSIQFAP